MTYAEYATQTGITPDTLRVRTDRMRKAGNLPDGTRYAASAPIPDAVRDYFEAKQKTDTAGAPRPAKKVPYAEKPKQKSKAENSISDSGQPTATQLPVNLSEQKIKRFAAFALLAVTVLIPVRNVYSVCSDLSGTADAVLFTAVLTAIAPLFVWLNVRAWWSNALIFSLISFEVFANTARVYSGLMFSGKYQYPTEFLGNVTAMLETRSHETALCLALLFAGLAAGAQYSLIKYLKKW